MTNADKRVEIVDREVVYSGWMRLCVASFRLADGRIMKREVLEHGQATSVLPYDAERRMAIVVRQFRAPVYLVAGQALLLEAIAGMVDDGDPEATARREAHEEAGLRLGALEAVGTVWPSPGMMTERVALFHARYAAEDRVGEGGGLKEEHEEIEVVELPLRELAALADKGALADMKTFALVQSLRLRKPELFE